jgi:hypothetical protein
MHGKPSPYNWGGSSDYVSGKFIRDHVYDSGTVDPQLGCAPLIARMMVADETINFAETPGKWSDNWTKPASPSATHVAPPADWIHTMGDKLSTLFEGRIRK